MRTLLTITGLTSLAAGAVWWAMVDAAAKTSLVLLAALLVSLAAYRSAASVRHLIWQLALTSTLLLPLLSVAVPQWKVLPAWIQMPEPRVTSPVSSVPSDAATVAALPPAPVITVPSPSPRDVRPATTVALDRAPSTPTATGEAAPPARLPLVPMLLLLWIVGTVFFLLRIVFGLWKLRRLMRRAVVVEGGRLQVAVQAVAAEMRLPPPRILMCDQTAMPAVCGLARGHLLLPAVAATWSDQRLRQVLLHELAHLLRRDPLTLLVAHLARACYWFNPLIWLAVMRLRIEQERACDDEVLRHGVLASDYAENILLLATALHPACPADAPALSMAQKCRIEQRLQVILDASRNRRAVSRSILAGVALTCCLAVVTLAGLRAAEEQKKPTPETNAAKAEDETDEPAAAPQFKSDYTRRFLNAVQYHRQPDGSYPQKTLTLLREVIERTVKDKPDWQDAAAARRWLEKTEQATDRSEAQLIELVEEAAAWSLPVVGWADVRETLAAMNIVRPGQEVVDDALKDVAFGPAAENGLRAGWKLEPTKPAYALGEIVDFHVYFHNSGDEPVQFVTHLWRQEDEWIIRDADGNVMRPRGTWFSGITPHGRYLLAPGQYVRVGAPGFAVGEGDHEEQFSTAKIGIVIPAEAGDQLRISRGLHVPGFSMGGPGLQSVPGEGDWSGALHTGEITLRIVAPDPDAVQIGSATFPGRYRLNDNVRLQVSRITHANGTFTNSARMQFLDDGDPQKPPRVEKTIELPNGLNTYVIGWQRDDEQLWIREATRWRWIQFAGADDIREREAAESAALEVPEAVLAKMMEVKVETPPPAVNQDPPEDVDPRDASDEPITAPAANAVEPTDNATLNALGLDLSRMRLAPHAREMPDLYEPAEEPDSWRLRRDVFQMPLGDGVWLHYAAAANRFYVDYRTNTDDPATERTYGPYDGDPFEVLSAPESRLRSQLANEHQIDATYRLRLMLRTGDPGLLRRALTMTHDTLVSDVATSTKHNMIHYLLPNITPLRETAPTDELKTLAVTVVREAARIEREIDLFAVEIADEDYSKAEEYPAPDVIPDELWGEAVDGLRMAVVPQSEEALVGQPTEFQVCLENVSDKPVKLTAWHLDDSTHVEVFDDDGQSVHVRDPVRIGIKPFPNRFLLQPGQRMSLGAVSVEFQPQPPNFHLHPVVPMGPGRFSLRFSSFGIGTQWTHDQDGRERRFVPAKGEWSGRLVSGQVPLRVVES